MILIIVIITIGSKEAIQLLHKKHFSREIGFTGSRIERETPNKTFQAFESLETFFSYSGIIQQSSLPA
jgi:hypothetical protein